MKNFTARLKQAMERGDFTVADLARWFDRPFHTVWFWVHEGRQPRQSRGQAKLMYRRLELAEKLIREKRGLPIPLHLSQFERPDYVGGLRRDNEAGRLSQGRTAG